MSNDAKTYRSFHISGAGTYRLAIGKLNRKRVPVIPVPEIDMPHMAQVECVFPWATRDELAASLDTARQEIEAESLGAIEAAFKKVMGEGCTFLPRPGHILVGGLGDPMLWTSNDYRIFKSALTLALAAISEMTSLRAVADRIWKNVHCGGCERLLTRTDGNR